MMQKPFSFSEVIPTIPSITYIIYIYYIYTDMYICAYIYIYIQIDRQMDG